ncbi:MAG: site-2 protease family protein [Gemmataceae bacterium]|nr:site-2 protease family protein [Gemmataceae bacterium]
MNRSIKLGRAFAIPLYLHPTFFLLPLYALALTASHGLAAVLLSQAVVLTVFGCVLLHELGHALAARAFGIRTRDITLYPIGGVARLESTGDRPVEEACIAFAGPAVNLVLLLLLAPVVLALAMLDLLATWGGQYVLAVAACNGILMLFNLIPAFPMDGGRVLRAVLASFLPRLRATAIAAYIGMALASGLALLGILFGNIGLVLVSVFVIVAGQAELAALRRHEEQETRRRAAQAERARVEQAVATFLWNPVLRAWVPWDGGRPAA